VSLQERLLTTYPYQTVVPQQGDSRDTHSGAHWDISNASLVVSDLNYNPELKSNCSRNVSPPGEGQARVGQNVISTIETWKFGTFLTKNYRYHGFSII